MPMPEDSGHNGELQSGPDSAGGYVLRVYPLDERNEIRLGELWRILWNRRWIIAVSALLGAVAAVGASFAITPEYRADIVIAPVKGDRNGGALAGLAGQLGSIASLAGVNLGADDTAAESLATLGSRALTERFIEKNNLLPVLFAELWDPVTSKWNVDDPADAPSLWRGYDFFDKAIRNVSQDAESGLVTLTIDWTDPGIAAEWANGLVFEANARLRSRAIEESAKNIEYLQTQLRQTSEVEVRTAVFGLMEAEMKNAMLSTVREEYAFKIIDPAVVPERSHWPNRWLFAVLGLFVGTTLSVIAVLVRSSRSP